MIIIIIIIIIIIWKVLSVIIKTITYASELFEHTDENLKKSQYNRRTDIDQ